MPLPLIVVAAGTALITGAAGAIGGSLVAPLMQPVVDFGKNVLSDSNKWIRHQIGVETQDERLVHDADDCIKELRNSISMGEIDKQTAITSLAKIILKLQRVNADFNIIDKYNDFAEELGKSENRSTIENNMGFTLNGGPSLAVESMNEPSNDFAKLRRTESKPIDEFSALLRAKKSPLDRPGPRPKLVNAIKEMSGMGVPANKITDIISIAKGGSSNKAKKGAEILGNVVGEMYNQFKRK